LLLGDALMMAIKAACDSVEDLQPLSAFLGHGLARMATDDSKGA